MIAYRLQAECLGDLDRDTQRYLDRVAAGTEGNKAPGHRRHALQPGTILVREWDGKSQRVMVLEEGFAWNGTIATKRRGLWVGGMVPLGYVSRDKKLVIEEEEAERVRTIFQRYLDLGSIGLLLADLRERGIVIKVRHPSNGRTVGGIPSPEARSPISCATASTSARSCSRARSAPQNIHRSSTATCSRPFSEGSPSSKMAVARPGRALPPC
jgi:hypothetical protein